MLFPAPGWTTGGFGLVDIQSSVCRQRRAKSSSSSNDHHSDVDVDRIPWIIDQQARDHDNPQTSETKRTSPSLVARLCRTTSSPTRMSNTHYRDRRSSQNTYYGHLHCGPVPAVFLVATPLPSIPPSQHAHHPQSLVAPMAAHDRTPSVVSSSRRRRHRPQTRV